MDINVTLIGQMITFLIFVALTMKFIWPPISKSLQERRQKIADGLAAAERGKHELEVAHHKAKEVIREAKAQASVIVEQANHRSHTIEEEARQEARSIIEKMKKAAEKEVQIEYVRAQDELRTKVAELAMMGAEKLLRKNIDKAANQAILDDLVKEIEHHG